MKSEESPEQKRTRAVEIVEALKAAYPAARVTLDYRTPFELLVAAILAAQCTDEKVNQITPGLFKRYPTIEAFAGADEAELQGIIRPTGFFRQKARSIMEAAQDIIAKFGGEVPQTMDELLQLRGVGRKTANLILGECFNVPGIVVDTHVKRISNRLGWTTNTDPTKIEYDLMDLIPKEHWVTINHVIVAHGRAICKAPKPLCDRCPVLELCPFGRSNQGMPPIGE